MKLPQVIHFLSFTLGALARLSPSPVQEPDTSTTHSTFPNITSSDVVYRYADLMTGPEPEDRFADLTANAKGWDPSAPTDGKIGMIRMSTVKQHVGELSGQRLWNVIHDALLKMCPYERGGLGCYPDMPGAGKPNDDNSLQSDHKYYDRVYILGVPYVTNKNEYAHNAWITITAQAIFREEKYPGIGAATYEMAAGVFKAATDTPGNCYVENFNKNSRPYQFCNVPHHVLVALPANNGDTTESWLSVTVEFNGKTRYGQFDCYNTMKAINNFWETAVLPDVTKSMGSQGRQWSINSGGLCMECWNEDDRFDLKTWRSHHTCDFLGWK